jgi:lipoyl(octanoyl) transferase
MSSSTAAPALAVVDWGRTDYETARLRQEELVAARIAGTAGDTLIFTEHDPVYTLGLRAGAADHLVWPPERLAAEGIGVVPTNRGGDITYHGPGQIVGYPIVSLAARRDLHAYLRFLEEVLIETVAGFGLAAARREGLTGIWIGPRKIAAIGVAVRRWVASHGFALNVAPQLAHFAGIVPCGIGPDRGTVTSLATELGRPVDPAAVKPVLAAVFARRWPGFAGAPAA